MEDKHALDLTRGNCSLDVHNQVAASAYCLTTFPSTFKSLCLIKKEKKSRINQLNCNLE